MKIRKRNLFLVICLAICVMGTGGWIVYHKIFSNPLFLKTWPQFFIAKNLYTEEEWMSVLNELIPVGSKREEVDNLLIKIVKLDYSEEPEAIKDSKKSYMYYFCDSTLCYEPGTIRILFDENNRLEKTDVSFAKTFMLGGGMRPYLIFGYKMKKNELRHE